MAFHTTRWSLIARAAAPDEAGRRALAELCGDYWPPVYAFYRQSGIGTDDARDLTQALFADLLERGTLGAGGAIDGRFRNFLCGCARHFLANHRDRERAQKRGGGRAPLPIDVDDEELRRAREPVDHLDPARAFDRRWAQSLVEQALLATERHERAAGRGEVFERLRPVLDGDGPDRPWAELAAQWSTSEGALRVAAHRLRARFREQLLALVRDTLGPADGPRDDEAELAELLRALSGG
ncbi:MAG: hypothetical protein R3F29_10620 [Planctomycetota bacterium]